jgi:hypothetical protein
MPTGAGLTPASARGYAPPAMMPAPQSTSAAVLRSIAAAIAIPR